MLGIERNTLDYQNDFTTLLFSSQNESEKDFIGKSAMTVEK